MYLNTTLNRFATKQSFRIVLTIERQAHYLMAPVLSVHGKRANFAGLVLGYTEADFLHPNIHWNMDLESSLRDLHDALRFTTLQSQFCPTLPTFCHGLTAFANFCIGLF